MNFKRKLPRARTRGNVNRGKTHFLKHWPKHHDVVYHRRPARRAQAAEIGKIRRAEIDPEEALFDPPKKPHVYYW